MYKYTCEVITDISINESGDSVTVYGLKFTGDFSQTFADLCTNFYKISKLSDLINTYKPSPKSIPDIIDDFLFNG